MNSCKNSDENATNQNKKDNSLKIDTISNKPRNNKYATPKNYFDSLANVKIDTTSLEGKRQKIMHLFLIERQSGIDYDTLIDLDYDGTKDYVLGYYGKSGTGIKNRIEAYLFNHKSNTYIYNEQLSNIANPTFYIKEHKITGFYIANGGGGGEKLEWIKNQWVVTKTFSVDYERDRDTTKWIITYPLKKRTEVITKPFQGIPPQEVLETNIKW